MQKQQVIIYARQSHVPEGQSVDQKRVFIYCRVAAEDNEKLGAQVQQCQDHCETDEFLVIDTFKEFGSGATLGREELTKMRERLSEVNAIVVIDRERLSRDINLYQALVQEMQQHSVELICVNE